MSSFSYLFLCLFLGKHGDLLLRNAMYCCIVCAKDCILKLILYFKAHLQTKYLSAFDLNVSNREESVLFQSGMGSKENCAIAVI